MKKIYKLLSALAVLTIGHGQINAQCTNSTAYLTAVAPAPGNSITLASCQYAGEYSTITGVVAGNNYFSSSSNATDFITIHSGTFNGPVVASGVTPLNWTAAVAGNHYVHSNTNASCGTASVCRDIYVGCALQSCTFATNNGSGTANSNGTVTISSCLNAGQNASVTYTTAGSYTATATGGTGNYITITNSSNVVIASGVSPLVYTIPSTGVYAAHLATSSSCATDAVCHTLTVARTVVPCFGSSQFPTTTTTSIAYTGTTNITTCNYAGEYSVNNFTATGTYTVISTGGAGNFLNITSNSNAPLTSGNSPLAVTIPSVGLYRIHIMTNSSCGTDATCHNVSVVGPGLPPAAPANDLCSAAQVITVPGTYTGTTISATGESPVPGICTGYTPNQPGVWYTVTGNGNKLGADLCTTSAWDSKIYVYSGSCGAWTCVSANDDNGPLCSSAAASATWCSVPSTVYYILVTGYSTPSAFSLVMTQTVPVAPAPVATASSPSVCPSSTVALTASGASTYSWSTSATTTSISVTPVGTTVYTLTGFAECANSVTTTVSVGNFASPVVSANSGSICSGNSFTIIPSGANTYTITGGNAVVSPVSNTSYSVTGTSANGCVSSNTAVSSVTVNSLPVVSAVSSSATICSGASVSITASGANTYSWSTTSTNTTIVDSPSSTTTYTVEGTTAGCTGSTTAMVTVNSLPAVSITGTAAICNGSSVILTGNGATTYSWNTSATTNTITDSPNANATYSVIGTDANNCSNTATFAVTVNSLPSVSITGTTTICNGGTVTLTGNGATTYSWSTSANTNTITDSPVANTTYSVIGTDANNCSNTATVAVTVNANPNVVIGTSQPTVCAGGTVNIGVTGATTYTWSTGSNSVSINPTVSATTNYSVVGETNGCISTASILITANANPTVSAVSSLSLICNGQSATLTASGANTYLWNTSATTTVISVTPSVTTSYTVTGTTNGCSSTFVVSQAVSPCTGINTNVASLSGMLVYPNPNTGEFTIELNNGSEKAIDIMDLTGRIVVSDKSNSDKINFNINTLANGVYYVRIQSNTSVEIVKIVKQ